MSSVKSGNGKLRRFSEGELAAMTRPAKAKTAAERRELVRRATTGLRVGVRVTRDMYRPR
jgi:hypothetical protein